MNKRLLITAGPTREALDAVRFFSNHATGRLGSLIADAALAKGWAVTLVLGPSSIEVHPEVDLVRVTSAQEMFEAVRKRFNDCDVFVASAAVADYRPKTVVDGKIKKSDDELTIELERTPDILHWAGQQRLIHQNLVGFALEADPDPALAKAKLERKSCDFLVHNTPANFGAGGGLVRLIDAQGELFSEEIGKEALALRLIDIIEQRFTSND